MNKIMVVFLLVAALCVGCATSQQELEKKVAVQKDKAQSIALATVPNGKIVATEIEKEKGLLVWSFDIATPNTKDITEVLVDAKTGKVISTEIEKPAKKADESKTEKKSQKK